MTRYGSPVGSNGLRSSTFSSSRGLARQCFGSLCRHRTGVMSRLQDGHRGGRKRDLPLVLHRVQTQVRLKYRAPRWQSLHG
jgi:hypothetical protein